MPAFRPERIGDLIVGLFIAAMVTWLIYANFGLWLSIALCPVFIYEAWAVANDRDGDTISERGWRLIARIPFLAGMLGFVLARLVSPEHDQIVILACVFAHLVWQSSAIYAKRGPLEPGQ